LECPFTRQVWHEIEIQMNVKHLWDRSSLEECFHGYFIRRLLKTIRTLHVLVAWGFWLAQNDSLFNDKQCPPYKVSQQSLALLSIYKPSFSYGFHMVGEVIINKEVAWGFFDVPVKDRNTLVAWDLFYTF
jgi:hypothetical protein